MSSKKKMTLRRWLYEHSPMAEGLLRQYDEQCEELVASEQPSRMIATFNTCPCCSEQTPTTHQPVEMPDDCRAAYDKWWLQQATTQEEPPSRLESFTAGWGARPTKRESVDHSESVSRHAVNKLLSEVDCRIEHGADSNGHLEYVRKELIEILTKEIEDNARRGSVQEGSENV